MPTHDFWSFNIGHLITMGMGLVSLVIVWQKLRDRVDELHTRITKQEGDLGEMTKMGIMTTVSQHERRITALESVASNISSIQSDIGWIKSWLRERDRDRQNRLENDQQ